MSLLDKLPVFYSGSSEIVNFQAALEVESDELKLSLEDVLKQLYVDTATWGLEYWERYLNLKIDENEPLINRRSRIKTMLRGQGTTTKEMLENVCASFVNGEVEIIELVSEYMFQIKFVGEVGIPSNVEYIRKTVELIKPAHLAFEFIYVFNTNAMLSVFTNNQLSPYTHYQLRNEVIS